MQKQLENIKNIATGLQLEAEKEVPNIYLIGEMIRVLNDLIAEIKKLDVEQAFKNLEIEWKNNYAK